MQTGAFSASSVLITKVTNKYVPIIQTGQNSLFLERVLSAELGLEAHLGKRGTEYFGLGARMKIEIIENRILQLCQ